MGFFKAFKDQVKDMAQEDQNKRTSRKDRKKELDKEGRAYCPKCLSTDLSANKRGFTLTTGMIGRNKIKVTCLKCGNKFKPGR